MKYFYPIYISAYIIIAFLIWFKGQQIDRQSEAERAKSQYYFDSTNRDYALRKLLSEEFIKKIPDSVKKLPIKQGIKWVTYNPVWIKIRYKRFVPFSRPQVWMDLFQSDKNYHPNNYDSVYVTKDSIIYRRQNGTLEHYSL